MSDGYPDKASVKADFPVGLYVEGVRLYKVELYVSPQQHKAIKFSYVRDVDSQVSFIDDTRWEPRKDSSTNQRDKKDVVRVLEHIASCFMTMEELYAEIQDCQDFADYASQYALALNTKLKQSNVRLTLKTLPVKGWITVGKFVPFVKGVGDEIEFAYSSWEQPKVDEYHAQQLLVVKEEVDNDLPF